MLIVYLIIVLVLIQLYKLWKIKVYKYRDLNVYPGPSLWEICVYVMGFRTPKETYEYMLNLNNVYGPVVKFWIKPFNPVLQVTATSFAEKILLSKTHLTKTGMYDLLHPYVGNGIGIIHSATDWKRYRTALNPTMNLQNINHLTSSVFDKNIDAMLNILSKNRNRRINIDQITHLFALDVIFEACLGHETNFLCNENRSYIDARDRYLEIIAKRMYRLYLKPNFIFNKTQYFNEMSNDANVLNKFLEKIARDKIDGNSELSKVLSCLTQSDFNFQEVKDNLGSMVLGGHDTIGTALAFCLFEIANRPEIQDRLLNEILGASNGEPICWNNIRQLKYIEAFIKETLRYHNIVPFIERELQEDIEIDGVKIAEGTQIRFNLAGFHKSEEYFKNPERFDPDRFLSENSENITKNSFVAFSLGPRDCIGKYYAMTILKQSIAKIIEKFVLKPVQPKHNFILIGELILKSLNGFPVIIEERNIHN